MAANPWDLDYPAVALTGTTVKTCGGVKAATNVRVQITESAVSSDGSTSSATPLKAEFSRCTMATNGPGTNSTSATLGKREPAAAETFQVTGAYNWTTEPTVITAFHTKYVAQYMGMYHYIMPFAAPIVVAGGAGWVIRLTPTASVNVSGHIAGVE